MTPCEQYMRLLAEGTAPSPELAAHVAACPACSALAAVDASLATALRDESTMAAMTLSPALRAALAGDHAPVRARSAWRRAIGAAGVAFGITAFIAVFHPRGDLPRVHVLAFALLGGVFAALASAGLAGVFARGSLGLGVPARWRWACVAATVALFGALEWTLHGGAALPDPEIAARTWWSHGSCAVLGSLVALVVGGLTFRAARGMDPVSPLSAGAAAGAAGGMAGALALHFSCGFTDPLHLVTMHIVPLGVGLALGSWLGPRRLAP